MSDDDKKRLIDRILEDINGPGSLEIIDDDPRPLTVLHNDATTQIEDEEFEHGLGGDSAFQSDQEHENDLREQARIGPNGEVLEEIDAKFQEAVMKAEEAAEVSPHRNVNPASWDRGILGNTVTVIPNQDTAAESLLQPLCYWPGDEREALPVLVTVTPELLPNVAASTGVYRPFARIRWGTRSEHVADVDIGTGIQLVVGGGSVYVDVGLDGGSDTQLQISGALAFWGGEKATQATRTAYVGSVADAATSAIQNRPRFANTIAAILRTTAPVVYTINFLDVNNNAIGAVLVAANTQPAMPIYLPNDCRAITITNSTGGGTAGTFRIVWGLSF